MGFKKILGGAAAFLLALSLAVCLFSQPALAYTRIETERETSLTIQYGDGERISGVSFSLYRVAEVSETVRFTLTEEFSDYRVSLEDLDSGDWRDLAETLAAYAARDRLSPLKTGETNREGRLVFSNLKTGLYLVVGERSRDGRYTYEPEPFLICLPNLSPSGLWQYNAEAAPKYEKDRRPSHGDDDTRDLRVRKVWEDDGAAGRPSKIEVQLLRNGRVYDTVTLSQRNNWRHTWYDLDRDDRWQVVEKRTPEGYTVSVNREGTTYLMTNTRTGRPPAPNPPEEHLPQTGQLWWPVAPLALAGMVLFGIGWQLERRR